MDLDFNGTVLKAFLSGTYQNFFAIYGMLIVPPGVYTLIFMEAFCEDDCMLIPK